MRLSPLAVFLLSLVAVFVAILLYGPLMVAIFFSFFRLERNEVQWDSFSFDAYRDLFHNSAVLDSLMNTLAVGLSAVALALVFGTLIAFHYRGSTSRMRHLLQLIVFLPFLMPPIITGLSLLIFFRELDIARSLATVVVGHTVFVLAIVYQIVLTRLQALRPSLIDASLDLGASRWQTFRFVLVPNLVVGFHLRRSSRFCAVVRRDADHASGDGDQEHAADVVVELDAPWLQVRHQRARCADPILLDGACLCGPAAVQAGAESVT